jgi:pimeloyl-ACP methyl ester carboxylesterase
MAAMYREFTRDFTVYAFSRINELPAGYTTRDMAWDLAQAMEQLGIEKADILGVSMGGMIAQHFAADFPEAVNKLVLVVTCPYCNEKVENSIYEWLGLARSGDHRSLMGSNLKLIYSEKYYRQNRWMLPVVGTLTKPKSYERFYRQAEACLSHDASERLAHIKAPTLIIGGAKDQVLGCEASVELNQNIPGSTLRIYPEGCHGLYEEEKDFNSFVLGFLMGETD